MVKWKRKKYLLAPDPQEEEEFSPLGLSLLEHFASGMSAPWQQWFEEFCFWCASFQPAFPCAAYVLSLAYVNQFLAPESSALC